MLLQILASAGLPGLPETELSIDGDTVTINGPSTDDAGATIHFDAVEFDLSEIPDGGRATPSGKHPFAGPITREGGVIHATIRVVLGDTAAPVQPSDPAHWTISVVDGPVTIPADRIEEPSE